MLAAQSVRVKEKQNTCISFDKEKISNSSFTLTFPAKRRFKKTTHNYLKLTKRTNVISRLVELSVSTLI